MATELKLKASGVQSDLMIPTIALSKKQKHQKPQTFKMRDDAHAFIYSVYTLKNRLSEYI